MVDLSFCFLLFLGLFSFFSFVSVIFQYVTFKLIFELYFIFVRPQIYDCLWCTLAHWVTCFSMKYHWLLLHSFKYLWLFSVLLTLSHSYPKFLQLYLTPIFSSPNNLVGSFWIPHPCSSLLVSVDHSLLFFSSPFFSWPCLVYCACSGYYLFYLPDARCLWL